MMDIRRLMQIISAVLLVSCCSVPRARYVSYRGWDRAVMMTNGTAKVIVNPQYGGNVIYFGPDDMSFNLMWADTVVNGWSIDDFLKTRRSPDAGRFDIGNERKTEYIHDSIWAGCYAVEEISAREVVITSPPSKEMGIVVSRRFLLDRDSSILKVCQEIRNITDTTVVYNFWTRTLLPSGGEFRCEADSIGEISLKNDSLTMEKLPPMVAVSSGEVNIRPGGAREYKFGIMNKDGICKYRVGGLVYTKQRMPYSDESIYENNAGLGFPLMIYFNGDFIEIEPNSPMYSIPPGQSACDWEKWSFSY